MTSPSDRALDDPVGRILVPLTAVGAILGTGVSLVLQPAAAISILAAGAMQLGATIAVAVLWRQPSIAAAVVAVTSAVTTFADPALAELSGRGAAAWLPLAITTAAQLVFRHARDVPSVVSGSIGLVVASTGPVGVNLAAGFPAAAAVLAGAVPILVGTLMAVTARLNDARRDRLSRGRHPVTSPPVDRRQQQLALAVLRLRELADTSPDPSTRRTASEIARSLHAATDGAEGDSTIRIEILPSSSPVPERTPILDPPPPDLTDREREILRLLVTGSSNSAISRDLYLSEATVKQYVSRLMRRFDCGNRTQLALTAHRWFGSR